MTRLYEEVLTRLEEMAMITVRALNMDVGDGMVQFHPLEEAGAELNSVAIVCTPHGNGCYDYAEGVCFRSA